jgi:pimeloyl-ACP methyl ester carboxylesterase
MPDRPVLAVTDAELGELRTRLAGTRWPAPWPVTGWAAGTDPVELRRLVAHWASGYDWRAHEAAINALPHRVADIAGTPVHYLRFDGEAPDALPIVLTNGWPSSFLELTGFAQRLATPSKHGGSAADSFTVIVPSLPGFAFSPQRPSLTDPGQTHELWHLLMREELGFTRYAAHGGDLGAGITSRLAEAHPEAVAGIHLMAVAGPGRRRKAPTSTSRAPGRSPWPTAWPTRPPGCSPGSSRSTARGATAEETCPRGSATTSC